MAAAGRRKLAHPVCWRRAAAPATAWAGRRAATAGKGRNDRRRGRAGERRRCSAAGSPATSDRTGGQSRDAGKAGVSAGGPAAGAGRPCRAGERNLMVASAARDVLAGARLRPGVERTRSAIHAAPHPVPTLATRRRRASPAADRRTRRGIPARGRRSAALVPRTAWQGAVADASAPRPRFRQAASPLRTNRPGWRRHLAVSWRQRE
jgi:hypothetical protein